MKFYHRVPKDISDIGLTPLLLEEFKRKSVTEDNHHEIFITKEKIMFCGSNLGLEIYINYFLQFSLNNFIQGFHIHSSCDPSEDFSSKELMICKGKPNLDLKENNIFIEGQYYRFDMPTAELDNLKSLKRQLEKERAKNEIFIDTEDNYPSPKICASGLAFCKLGKSLFLFNKLPELTSFYIFDDLEFLKK